MNKWINKWCFSNDTKSWTLGPWYLFFHKHSLRYPYTHCCADVKKVRNFSRVHQALDGEGWSGYHTSLTLSQCFSYSARLPHAVSTSQIKGHAKFEIEKNPESREDRSLGQFLLWEERELGIVPWDDKWEERGWEGMSCKNPKSQRHEMCRILNQSPFTINLTP